MSIVPGNRLGKIEFYEAHLPAWTANAAAIGLTPLQITTFTPLVTNARAAYNAHVVAQEAARAATNNFYDKVLAMHANPGAGADLIQIIKTFAQTSNNPNVYVLAQIPPPNPPGVVPPPGTPFDFVAALRQDGSLDLKWKCNNPVGAIGTIYEIKRQTTGEGAFTFIGASGLKSFVDDTLPGGASPATYQITAVRSTSRGNPAQFTVKFGLGGNNVTVESVSGGEGGLQMAA